MYFRYAEYKCPVCGASEHFPPPTGGTRWRSRPCRVNRSHTPSDHLIMGSSIPLDTPVETWREVLAVIAARAAATAPPPDPS